MAGAPFSLSDKIFTFHVCWRIYDVGMRRLILVAAFVFASGVVPALAQRGGHGGLPGRGGFGGHVSGAASHGGMRGGSSFHSPRFRSSGFPNRNFPNRGPRNLSFGRRGFSHDPFLRNRGFQRNRFDRFDHDRDDSRFRFGLQLLRFQLRLGMGMARVVGFEFLLRPESRGRSRAC